MHKGHLLTSPSKVDLTLRFQGLEMEESDDEYTADNYTFSPKFSTIRDGRDGIDWGNNVPLPESGLYRRHEAQNYFNTSKERSKIHLDAQSDDRTLAINPASPNLDESRAQMSQVGIEYQCLEKQVIRVPGHLVDPTSNQVDEDISVELCNLHLGPNSTIRPSSPMVDTLTADFECTTETTTSLEFDLGAYSIIGVGSWIEYDTHDLRPLDLDVFGEGYSIKDHLKGPEDQKQHPNFTSCHNNSAAGSTPQKDSGTSSSDFGSGETNQLPPNGGRHHKHPSDGSDGAGEGDDPTQSKRARTESGTNRRFVCPFHIHDPAYFKTSSENGQKYTLCANGIGFPDIARVK